MGLASFEPLRHRDFGIVWAGSLVSQIGTAMQRAALAWQFAELAGNNPFDQGTIGLVRIIPMIAVALVGGVVADAVDRRRLLLVTQTIFAAISGALAWTTWQGTVSIPLLYAATAVSGALFGLDNPAQQALLPNLVPPEVLPRAISLRIFSWQLATVVGPALGGIALAQKGPGFVYAFDCVSFGAMILGLLSIRWRPIAAPTVRPTIGAAVEGIKFIRKHPVLFQTILLDFLATFFVESQLQLPIFAKEILKVGPEQYGLLLAGPAIGGVITSFIMAGLPPPKAQGKAIVISVWIYGAAMVLFGLSRNLAEGMFSLALVGAADTVSMGVRNTLRQELTPDSMRGRMTSVSMIFFAGGPQLGEFEAGVVAHFFGLRWAFLSGGYACVALATGFGVFAKELVGQRRDGPPVPLGEGPK